ncbi:MAG: hypothetical protein U0893_18155 [Chloroflexota bacterium]
MERGCLGSVGIGIVLVSGFFVASALGDLETGGDGKTSTGVLLGLLVFFGGLLAGGAYLAWRAFRPSGAGVTVSGPYEAAGPSQPPPPRTDADRERDILRYAELEHGRVTVTEVATHCDLSMADAKAALDRLVTQQAAEIRVTQAGVLVYVFPGFLSDDDKSKASDF